MPPTELNAIGGSALSSPLAPYPPAHGSPRHIRRTLPHRPRAPLANHQPWPKRAGAGTPGPRVDGRAAGREVSEIKRGRGGTRRGPARRGQREGERGPVWWTDGEPDWNRHLVKNSPYAGWFYQQANGEAEAGEL